MESVEKSERILKRASLTYGAGLILLTAQADKVIGKHVVVSWGSARGSILYAILAGKGEFE
jgi:hypothetical protein